VDKTRGLTSCIKNSTPERSSCYCSYGEKFPRFSSIVVNIVLSYAVTCMRKTFYEGVYLVSVMQNTWGYSFTAMYRTSRPFWTADIGPSYQVYRVLSTKLELYVSEGFRLISQFKNSHVRNFAFQELRDYALSVKGIRGNKNGKKFWCGFKCRADEVYVHVSSMECRTKS
jgi:hypothetical protein